MAPRTRSNRVLARQELLASGRPLNASGLPALADEIYVEITSQIQTAPVPMIIGSGIDEGHRHRHQTLLSLSQTCRSLRRVFLRYLWQRIEVLDGMQTSTGMLPISASTTKYPRGPPRSSEKKFAEELVSQLEVVTIREPNLAPHVNVVNVTVLEYSAGTVLPELARCLALFPNLHTVQLNFKIRPWRYPILNSLFTRYQYPQVRTVCLSPYASRFLHSCPGVRSVHSYSSMPWCSSLRFVLVHPRLEILGAISVYDGMITDIVEKLPKLREVCLCRMLLRLVGFDEVKKLSQLSQLATIRLGTHIGHPSPHAATQEEIEQWIEWAKKILTDVRSSTTSKRKVILVRQDGREEVYNVS